MHTPSLERNKVMARDGMRNFLLLANSLKQRADKADLARERIAKFRLSSARMIELGQHRNLVKNRA